MIASDGHLRLIDFGLSKILDKGERTNSVVGSPEYIAPEVLMKGGYGFEVDFWALGVLVYELLTGRTPFKSESSYETYDKIKNCDYSFSKSFDPIARDLIRGLLCQNPASRFKAADLRGH
jgi:serine/threonine protein kinase